MNIIECIICWDNKPKYTDDIDITICKHNICGDCYYHYSMTTSSTDVINEIVLCPNCRTNIYNPYIMLKNILERCEIQTYKCLFDSKIDKMTKQMKEFIAFDPNSGLLIGYEFELHGIWHFYDINYCFFHGVFAWCSTHYTWFLLKIYYDQLDKQKCEQIINTKKIQMITIKQPSME